MSSRRSDNEPDPVSDFLSSQRKSVFLRDAEVKKIVPSSHIMKTPNYSRGDILDLHHGDGFQRRSHGARKSGMTVDGEAGKKKKKGVSYQRNKSDDTSDQRKNSNDASDQRKLSDDKSAQQELVDKPEIEPKSEADKEPDAKPEAVDKSIPKTDTPEKSGQSKDLSRCDAEEKGTKKGKKEKKAKKELLLMMDCAYFGNYTCPDVTSTGSECYRSSNGYCSSVPSICSLGTGKSRKKDVLGFFISSNQGKLLPSHHSEKEEASKQFNWKWPKYWEWPPCSTDWDVCSSIPSETELQPKGLCVTLEAPVPKKRTYPLSRTFFVIPEFVVFRQDALTGVWDEFAWIRVQNKGGISRRLNLVPPLNSAFTVVWAATLKEKTTVPPGLYVRILIQFTPQSNERITDELVIRVEGDGGIVVPIIASPQDPPLLELDDFSCGCCLIGSKLIHTFQIKNLGGPGRFWLLPEAEFMNEKFGVPSPPPTVEIQPKVCSPPPEPDEMLGEQESFQDEDEAGPNELGSVEPSADTEEAPEAEANSSPPGEVIVQEEEETFENIIPKGQCIDATGEDELEDAKPPPNTPAEPKKIFRPGQLHVPPFGLAPACFSLKNSQEIKVKVSFTPLEAKFFHERVAILCENGEVRWLILKSLGIEPKSQKIITIQGDTWISDGPTTTLDLGDLCADEPLKQNLKIRNSSAVPVYFRWVLDSAIKEPLSPAALYGQTQGKVTQVTLEAEDEGGEDAEKEIELIPGIPLTITPEEGFLKGCGEVDCTMDLVCPTSLGTYSSRLCLHISEFSQEAHRVLEKISERELKYELERHLKVNSKSSLEKENPFKVSAYITPPCFEIPPISPEPLSALEIWLRSVPLQCFFEPPLLKCNGMAFTQLKMRLKFYNSTKHPVKLCLGEVQAETINIKVTPETLNVLPQTQACLKLTLRFQQPGEIQADLKGVLQLPFKTVNIYLPMRILTDPPLLCQDVTEEIPADEAIDAEQLPELGEVIEYVPSEEVENAGEE